VKGDIVHSSLQIQSNAVFEGQVKHSDDPLKDAAPRAAASDARPAASSSAPSATPNAAGGFGISPTAS
jgi:cytoskeletal protein CcmA (bactofilin family)